MMRTDVNYKKKNRDLFFAFSMAANDKKTSVLAMELEPVTVTDPNFFKWADQRLYNTLGTRS